MSTVLPGGVAPGTPAAPVPDELAYQTNRLVAYRDDGPIALALGKLTRGQLLPLLPLLVAGLVTGVLLVADANGQSSPAIFAPLLLLLLVGPGSTHRHSGRLDWLIPPLMRAIEYAFLATLGFSHDVS